MKESAVKYLTCLVMPVIIAIAALSLSWFFLWQAGEYRAMDEVVRRQLESGGLYNSALEQTSYGYKQALYRQVRPRVAALGSSRVMQFQGGMFTVSFVTMGGSAGGLMELEKSLREMLSAHKPEMIILGLDFWWFNDGYAEPLATRGRQRFETKNKASLSHLVEPYKWLLEGKLKPSVFLNVMTQPPVHQGIAPIAKGDGYDAQGAYHYVFETSRAARKPFDWDRRRMERGDRIYAPGDEISEERWRQFEKIVGIFERSGVKLILFLPPVSPATYEFLQNSGRHGYIEKLRTRLAGYRHTVYDYHDPATLGGDPCEFVDAHHAGTIFYRRILLDMAMRENSPLVSYVDVNGLFEDIKAHRGHATLWPPGMFPELKEADFLGIGCPKD